ncbi:MAG: hypothetical protein QM757_05210 [Paludibaculum sp.]
MNLIWRHTDSRAQFPCILISLLEQSAEEERPEALAFAQPYGDGRIVVFHDRVRQRAWPSLTPTLLGYVLAHEIGHILQGVERHSDTGIMKSRWLYGDYKSMAMDRLSFTPEDAAMIRHGLEVRISRDSTTSPYHAGGAEGL